MGCGEGWVSAVQLFFMSLTGNSIPIKFTPFGRIQREWDRVRETEESGGKQTDARDMVPIQGLASPALP